MATPGSHTSAHELIVTVAPFQAWRSSLSIVARGPTEVTITTASDACGADYPHFAELMQQLAPIEQRLIDIGALHTTKIGQKWLTSTYGSEMAVTAAKNKGLLPKESLQALAFRPTSTKDVTIDQNIRGAVVIAAEQQSWLRIALKVIALIIKREQGI